MAARTPRRTFAHPFVVTLAAVPACAGPQQPPHRNPPPPPMDPATPAPDPGQTAPTTPTTPTDPASPAPSPGGTGQAQQKPPDHTERWIVTRNGATCMATPRVECPTAAPGKPMPTCNPPPASAYPCPDGMAEPSLTVVQYANTFECVIQPAPPRCPPNAACNPPPPRRVACPK